MSLMNIELILLTVLPVLIAVFMYFSTDFNRHSRNFIAIMGAGIELALVISLFVLNFEAVKNSNFFLQYTLGYTCLLYTSPSPRDRTRSRMPSSA